jgi:hypothetical protein
VAVTSVCLEIARRRVFASALDWPGWCRAGKDEALALEALAAALPRYRVVTDEAGVRLPANAAETFDVVERLEGNATTEFGAPGIVAAAEREPVSAAQAKRLAALLAASWTVLDRVAAGAPASLRKGPRGGGRDRDAVVAHVLGAEAGYSRQVGLRLREPAVGDTAAIAAHREAFLEVVRAGSDGSPLKVNGWPLRYAVRRIAWHVLDHAWEIEDRSE